MSFYLTNVYYNFFVGRVVNKIRKLLIFSFCLLILILFINTIAFPMASCTKESSFGQLTICESVKADTKEPDIVKNEFDINAKEIIATIKILNVKADDNYRFTWKNAEDDSIVTEVSEKYLEGKKGLISSFLMSNIKLEGDNVILFPPGKYKVEFYHNGELKSSAEFTVKTPKINILDVKLAKEVGQQSEPINPSQNFDPNDTIYACVQLDYFILGNTIKAKFLDEKGKVLLETPFEIPEPYFKPALINFSMYASESQGPPEGNETYAPKNEKEFGKIFEDIVDNTRKDMELVGDPVVSEKKLKSGDTFGEIIYYFKDKDNLKFGLILSDFMHNNLFYIWYGFAHEAFYESLNKAYYTCLNSIEFRG